MAQTLRLRSTAISEEAGDRHGFSQAPEAARRERAQLREGEGVARSQWGQRDLHGQFQ